MAVNAERIIELLEGIGCELRAIRVAIERQRPTSLSRRDLERLERLLPAWAGNRGSEAVLVRELLEAHAIRLVLGDDTTARALGKLLAAAAGVSIAGYVVNRVGSEDGAALWTVAEVVSTP
jgi:hypothetical protein